MLRVATWQAGWQTGRAYTLKGRQARQAARDMAEARWSDLAILQGTEELYPEQGPTPQG